MCRITAGTGIVSCQSLPETCKSVCTLFEPDFPKNEMASLVDVETTDLALIFEQESLAVAGFYSKGAAEAEAWSCIQQDETAGIGVRVSQCLPETCKIKWQLV